MNWKKNGISYLFWFVYALVTGGVTVILAAMVCRDAGVGAFGGGMVALLYMGIAGGIVFCAHHLKVKIDRNLLRVLEVLLVTLFMALGLALRMRNIGEAGQQASDYYEIAKVAGQEIPYITHGAVYFYVWMLRGSFSLLGNHLVVGIWVQVTMQLVASFVLYFILRKLTGIIPALITLGFCMCAPYMVHISLVLSPELLYFGLFVAAVGAVAVCRKSLGYGVFFPIGILAAVCSYLDVAGILVSGMALAVIFCRREEAPDTGKRLKAVLLCLGGAVLGFLSCVLLDAYISGTSFQGVLQAWGLLYRPEHFGVPFGISQDGIASGRLLVSASVPEGLFLCGCLVFGIFGFWRDGQKDRMTPYVAAICGIVLAGCFGIFTEEMSGEFYLYLLLVIVAGIGVGQCFGSVSVGQEGEADGRAAYQGKEVDGGAAGYQGNKAGGGVAGYQGKEADGGVADYQMDRVSGRIGYQTDETADNVYYPVDEVANAVRYQENEIDGLGGERNGYSGQEGQQIKFLDNPLPLPKKHVKRVLDYPLKAVSEEEDFDFDISEEDDFDI